MINRWVGTRVAYVAVTVAIYFGTLGVLGASSELAQNTGEILDTLQWVVLTIGAAIIGDTLRPSKQATSAFTVEKRAEVQAIPQHFETATVTGREKRTIVPESKPL